MKLGEKIKIIRKARGLSQEGLGFSLSRVSKDGVSRQAVSDWENDKSEPCLENIRDLAEVLGVSFDALLDENIDLNDPEILSSVLLKQQSIQSEQKNEVTASCRFAIKTHVKLKVKNFKLLITGVCLLILFLIVGFTVNHFIKGTKGNNFFYIFIPISGALTALPLIISFSVEIMPIFLKSNYKIMGSISFSYLAIDDDCVLIKGYTNMHNRLYIPMDSIVEIKLGDNQKKYYGDVIVIVKDKENPVLMKDIINAPGLIATYNRIIDYLNKE